MAAWLSASTLLVGLVAVRRHRFCRSAERRRLSEPAPFSFRARKRRNGSPRGPRMPRPGVHPRQPNTPKVLRCAFERRRDRSLDPAQGLRTSIRTALDRQRLRSAASPTTTWRVPAVAQAADRRGDASSISDGLSGRLDGAKVRPGIHFARRRRRSAAGTARARRTADYVISRSSASPILGRQEPVAGPSDRDRQGIVGLAELRAQVLAQIWPRVRL